MPAPGGGTWEQLARREWDGRVLRMRHELEVARDRLRSAMEADQAARNTLEENARRQPDLRHRVERQRELLDEERRAADMQIRSAQARDQEERARAVQPGRAGY
jgi:hypothetical protein